MFEGGHFSLYNMEKSGFLILLMFAGALCNENIATTGSFFSEEKGDDKHEESKDSTIITQEFFSCGNVGDCLQVGKKDTQYKSISAGTDDTILKDFDELWKKKGLYKGTC